MNRRPSSRWPHVVLAGILAILAFAMTVVVSSESADASFAVENRAAMAKMMAAMEIDASGDVDKDFVAMMIPHHQGAIEMAQAELRHGGNKRLRRIAQEIIVEQRQEIVAMRLALSQSLPSPSSAPPRVMAVAGPPASGEARPWSSAWSKVASICRSHR